MRNRRKTLSVQLHLKQHFRSALFPSLDRAERYLWQHISPSLMIMVKGLLSGQLSSKQTYDKRPKNQIEKTNLDTVNF